MTQLFVSIKKFGGFSRFYLIQMQFRQVSKSLDKSFLSIICHLLVRYFFLNMKNLDRKSDH